MQLKWALAKLQKEFIFCESGAQKRKLQKLTQEPKGESITSSSTLQIFSNSDPSNSPVSVHVTFFFKQNINTEAEVCIKEELVGCVFGKETHLLVYPSFLETWVSATVFKSKFEWCRKQTCRRNASKIKILVSMIIASFLFNIDLI